MVERYILGQSDGDGARQNRERMVQFQVNGEPGRLFLVGDDLVIKFEHDAGFDCAEGHDLLPPTCVFGPARDVVGCGKIERVFRHRDGLAAGQNSLSSMDGDLLATVAEVNARISHRADGAALEQLDELVFPATDPAIVEQRPVLIPTQDYRAGFGKARRIHIAAGHGRLGGGECCGYEQCNEIRQRAPGNRILMHGPPSLNEHRRVLRRIGQRYTRPIPLRVDSLNRASS